MNFTDAPFTNRRGKSNATSGCEPDRATQKVFVLTKLLQEEAVFRALPSHERRRQRQVRADGFPAPRRAFPVCLEESAAQFLLRTEH